MLENLFGFVPAMHEVHFAKDSEARSSVRYFVEPLKRHSPEPQKPAEIIEIRAARDKGGEACIGEAQKAPGTPMPTPIKSCSDA